MRELLELLEAGPSNSLLLGLAWLAGQGIELDEEEVRASVRRAELLLAAGGDPRRELELDGRAVAAVAADLDEPGARARLKTPSARSRPKPTDWTRSPRRSHSCARSRIWPGSATRARYSPRPSAATDPPGRPLGGPGDLDVAADRLDLQPCLGATRPLGRLVLDVELGADVAARRAGVDAQPRTRADAEPDVAETDWSLICPSRIAPMRWSPETVLPDRSDCASSIARSPDTSVASAGPPTEPSRTSPETVWTLASPSTKAARTSPLADWRVRRLARRQRP